MTDKVVQQQANVTSGSLAQQLTAATDKPNNVGQKEGKWTVPTLPLHFNLDQALDTALVAAGSYMNSVLAQDDLVVEMQQNDNKMTGVVTDIVTGKEVSRYGGRQLLKLFAKHYQQTGVVVDGKV